MRRWFAPNILVLGSVHIDTIADIATEHQDAEGSITRSIGGAAFNIATNLRLSDLWANVALYTFLPRRSLLTSIIVDKIKKRQISRKYVRVRDRLHNERVVEGGFLALRNRTTGYTIRAATQAPIGQEDFLLDLSEMRRLRAAVRSASVVVIDTNLHRDSLEKAIVIVAEAKRPLIVSVASDHKARRYRDCREAKPEVCLTVAVSSLELASILKCDLDDATVEKFIAAAEQGAELPPVPTPAQVCGAAKSQNAICVAKSKTGGPGAFYIFSANGPSDAGSCLKIEPPSDVDDGSRRGTRTGLTDAVTSACIDVVVRRLEEARQKNGAQNCRTVTLADAAHADRICATIRDYVGRVIAVKAAAPHAETDYYEETVPRSRLAHTYDRVVGKLVEDWAAVLAGAGLALLATHGLTILDTLWHAVFCAMQKACLQASWIALLDWLKALVQP